MRILQIGKFYHPVRGGMESVLKLLCDGLHARGHQLTVLCASDSKKSLEDEVDGIPIIRAGRWAHLFSQSICPSLHTQMGSLLRSHDLIHVHSPNPLIETHLLTLKNIPPVVVTYHADITRQKVLGALYLPLLKRFLHSKVQKIIATAQPNIDHSPVLPEFQEKCQVIPLSLSEEKYQLTPQIEERAKKLQKPYILFIGRLVTYKGLDVLLKAMQKIDTHLVIIGSGPEEQNLKTLANELKVADKMTFTGTVESHEDLLAYLHGCELFVLPSISRAEAFGVVLLEAMAMGKPLVTTRLNSGVRTVNAPNIVGLEADPENVDQLAEAILKILNDPELKRQFSEAARKRFYEFYTAEKMIDRHIQVYQNILSKSLS